MSILMRLYMRLRSSRRAPFVHIEEGLRRFGDKMRSRRVLARKQAQIIAGIGYKDCPRVSFVLQFFNKRENISRIAAQLVPLADELIVIDDGSIDGSHRKWMAILNRPNHFLIRSNDLYEVRTYDRAMSMARGEFVCFLQDDDFPPDNNGKWLEQAISLYRRFPRLLVLGGRWGSDIMAPDPVTEGTISKYVRTGDIGTFPGVRKHRVYEKPLLKDELTEIPFMFAMNVNRAPWFVRREEMLRLGGLNQEYAPFQCDDVDACIRSWLAGHEVGFFDAGFAGNIGVGGMRKFNSGRVEEQVIANWQKIYRDYGSVIRDGSLQCMVDDSNLTLSARSPALSDNQ